MSFRLVPGGRDCQVLYISYQQMHNLRTSSLQFEANCARCIVEQKSHASGDTTSQSLSRFLFLHSTQIQHVSFDNFEKLSTTSWFQCGSRKVPSRKSQVAISTLLKRDLVRCLLSVCSASLDPLQLCSNWRSGYNSNSQDCRSASGQPRGIHSTHSSCFTTSSQHRILVHIRRCTDTSKFQFPYVLHNATQNHESM